MPAFHQDAFGRLADAIRGAGFWSRLFRWRKQREEILDALNEVRAGLTELAGVRNENVYLEERLREQDRDLERAAQNQFRSDYELQQMTAQLARLDAALQEHRAGERQLRELHDRAMDRLTATQERIENERAAERDARTQAELARVQAMKAAWIAHEADCRSHIRAVARRLGIEYVADVPFRGEPDNALQIAGEYLVLDAKSPVGDDPASFGKYLKDQADRAHKYARQENVRSDIFFVLPPSAMERLDVFSHHYPEYSVYFIPTGAVEPVLATFRRIEGYEFAQQLSPDEREQICRTLGQYAHLAKRRLQVDGWFARQTLDLIHRSENNLPADMVESAAQFEQSGKLNPPVEKKVKVISVRELEEERRRLEETLFARNLAGADALTVETGGNAPGQSLV